MGKSCFRNVKMPTYLCNIRAMINPPDLIKTMLNKIHENLMTQAYRIDKNIA